ncbi:MAG: cysteine desulfurase NifS, partial [Candidatus Sumerlaeia bacterium]|nr:cysteine desulfurase NifS [Candidatus Sumerlaeia bacterium]
GFGATVAPGFINISVPGLAGPDLVIALDGRGIAVSSGSACATGVMETSEALAAMFPDNPGRAAGALRITPWRETSVGDMIAVADALAEITGH